MINVHVSAAAPDIVMERMVSRLDKLEEFIQNLNSSSQTMETQSRRQDGVADEHESFILRTNRQLIQVASQLVEEVSTVVSDARYVSVLIIYCLILIHSGAQSSGELSLAWTILRLRVVCRCAPLGIVLEVLRLQVQSRTDSGHTGHRHQTRH